MEKIGFEPGLKESEFCVMRDKDLVEEDGLGRSEFEMERLV